MTIRPLVRSLSYSASMPLDVRRRQGDVVPALPSLPYPYYLERWYDASDEDTITQSGGAVSQWDDKSGNDDHATQPANPEKPTVPEDTINGESIIRLSGAQFFYMAALSTGDKTITVIHKGQSSSGDTSTFIGSDTFNGSVSTAYLPLAADGNASSEMFRGISGVTTYVDGEEISVSNRGQLYDAIINDEVQVTTFTGNITVSDFEFLFSSAFGYAYLGDVLEVIIYDRELTEHQVGEVAYYGASKWGIAGVSTPKQQTIVASGTNMPEGLTDRQSTLNHIDNNLIPHTIVEDCEEITFVYYNAVFRADDGEYNGPANMFIRSAVIKDVVYDVDNDISSYTQQSLASSEGNQDEYLDKAFGIARFTATGPFSKGDVIYEVNRRFAVTGDDVTFNAAGEITGGTDQALTQIQSGTRTSGSAVITGMSDTSVFTVGENVTGSGIPSSTTVSSIDSGTQITLSNNATSSGTDDLKVGTLFAWSASTTYNPIAGKAYTNGTDEAVDWTTDPALEFGLSVGALNVNASGGAELTFVESEGANLASPVYSLISYRGIGSHVATGLKPGTGGTGYLSRVGGNYRATVTSAGTGNDTSNPPIGYPNDGIYNNQGIYGAAFIYGLTDAGKVSGIHMGDSYSAGNNIDPSGILNIYTSLYQPNYAFMRMAVNGRSATGWNLNKTNQQALFSSMTDWGVVITHFFNTLGVNDFGSATPNIDIGSAVVTNVNNVNLQIQNYWPDAKIIGITIPSCRTSSTDGWATAANQTLYSISYADDDGNPHDGSASSTAYGAVQYFNNSVANNENGYYADITVDTRGVFNDSVEVGKWGQLTSARIPALGGDTLTLTGDGVHANGDAFYERLQNQTKLSLTVN